VVGPTVTTAQVVSGNGAGDHDVVTLGESMGLLSAEATIGPLSSAVPLRIAVGGAESNVAIGLARLGWRSAWLGRVGRDSLGDMVVNVIRGEGVTTVAIPDDAPTSLMLKERRLADVTRLVYYRRNGPGSHLTPADVDRDLVERSRILHVTGVTLALSDSASDAVHAAIDIARDAGVRVSVDVNYRESLWSSRTRASAELTALSARADVIFAGRSEASLLGFDGPPPDQAEGLLSLGAQEVVVKLGAHGAVALARDGYFEAPAVAVRAVDPVGAGDAFAAGYLAGILGEEPTVRRLRIGTQCGALVAGCSGDWEGAPRLHELALLTLGADDVIR
jgi:2-dehydro-3-deoxygluconokinase